MSASRLLHSVARNNFFAPDLFWRGSPEENGVRYADPPQPEKLNGPPERKLIRIGVILGHAITRIGLRWLLTSQSDMTVIAEASNTEEALSRIQQGPMDLLVADLVTPGARGLDALTTFAARFPKLPILVHSACPEERCVNTLRKMGLAGFVSKDVTPNDFCEAIRSVMHSGYCWSSSAQSIFSVHAGCPTAPHDRLTTKEFQVFLKFALGSTNASVARDLRLTKYSITSHRTKIFRKLDVRTDSGLAYYAVTRGILDCVHGEHL